MAGIKLFGKMIVLQNKKEKDEETTADLTPEKMPIPCPRCKSKETKFCYFNNYNVNQPRHFCKGCQRYWTAGGALRNVPIGAGRRKNKPLWANTNQFPTSCLSTVADWPLTTSQDIWNDFPAKRQRFSQTFDCPL